MKPSLDLHSRAPAWDGLYKIGGVTALVLVAIPLVQLVVFAVAPPPLEGGAAEWFTIFQENAILGLLGFEILLVVYSLLSVALSLTLFVVLRPSARTLSALFLASSLIGAVAFVTARPAFEMLYLSHQYTTATTEAQRAVILGAGEAMIATFHGTAFLVSYILGSVTGFLIGAAMLRVRVFGRATAYLRLGSAIFDFGIFIPGIGLYISILSVLLLLAFHVLVGIRLLRMPSMAPELGRSNGV
jgi:hypothetical protein